MKVEYIWVGDPAPVSVMVPTPEIKKRPKTPIILLHYLVSDSITRM